jgi:uncharacterized protein (DUF2062 family)
MVDQIIIAVLAFPVGVYMVHLFNERELRRKRKRRARRGKNQEG